MILNYNIYLNFKFPFDNHPGGMLNAAKISDLVEGSFLLTESVSENLENSMNGKRDLK